MPLCQYKKAKVKPRSAESFSIWNNHLLLHLLDRALLMTLKAPFGHEPHTTGLESCAAFSPPDDLKEQGKKSFQQARQGKTKGQIAFFGSYSWHPFVVPNLVDLE